jgi:hypothetical protein
MIKENKKNDEVNYKDEGKHSRIVPNRLFIEDVQILNPLSQKYITYWKHQKRRCVEGYWAEGKWMPGNLYFYINFCKISLNKDNASKTKITARPFLRDLEWEKAYVFAEARGFSGFAEDKEYTCYLPIGLYEEETIDISIYEIPKSCYRPDGTFKKFMEPRKYLRLIHSKNLGKPLYENNAWNVIDIECRGSGKSFWASGGMIAWHYLFDGATDYDEFLRLRKEGNGMKSETLVGAIDEKYSKDLLTKVQGSLDSLVGSQHFQGEYYPSPFFKDFTGSWYSGKKFIEAKVDKKIGGRWQRIGSGSVVHHRSFKDNPLAGNGTRPGLSCLEEVGFMNNLKASLGAMKDTTYNGAIKFGTIYMFGTGGGMESGASEESMEVFNDPRSFDCLPFMDTWEETGEIGFFVPYEMGLNQFKDKEGNTDMERSTRFVDSVREKKAAGKSKKPLYDEMQNNPRVPSEAFLIMNANIFPIGELKEHLGWLKTNQHDGFVKGTCGELVFKQREGAGKDDAPELKWEPDLKNVLKPTWFKMSKTDDTTGCIQIWEHPQKVNGKVPFGLYLAGTDPYDQDQAPNTPSLGSTFIYKTHYTEEGIYHWPVAEYTARPSTAEEHHEIIRKLLMYYNAVDLYENERNTLKMHFSHKNSLHLLARQPDILKATEGSKVQRMYGIHMTEQIKDEIEIYTRDWLLQDAGNGKLNLHKIYSIPLIQELIFYNRRGNYDRVIAFMLTIVHMLQRKQLIVTEARGEKYGMDPFFARALKGRFFK